MEDIYEDLDDQMKFILSNNDVDNTQELGIKHLAYVRAAMVSVAANWHNIGLFLRVDSDKLDGFKRQYKRDSDRCLTDTIHAWLAGRSTKHTWRDVVLAVGSETAGANPAEAETLAKGEFSSMLRGVPESAGVDTKPLGKADQYQVHVALKPVGDKWMEIGVFLGLKYSHLKLATEDEDDKMAYIATQYTNKQYMLEMYGEPTWKHLVEAIGSRAGADNPRHAEEIAKKHQAIQIVEEADSSTNVELVPSVLCKQGGIAKCIDENPRARGLAVVITNDYNGSLHGTREDAKSLCETFSFAQFIVCYKQNASGDELLQLVDELKNLKFEQVKNYECILFAFSGHGDEGDWIYMEDDEKIQVYDQVLAPLLADSAPELGDIPKVVLSDACRGDNETQTTLVPVAKNPDSTTNTGERQLRRVPSTGNFLVACATMAEHYAYMRPDNLGSAWTQTLAAELKHKDNKEEDLEGVLTKVNAKMVERAQKDHVEFQQPEKHSTLNRKVYIYPQQEP